MLAFYVFACVGAIKLGGGGPAASSSSAPLVGVCQAVDRSRASDMDYWCDTNCRANHCPPNTCTDGCLHGAPAKNVPVDLVLVLVGGEGWETDRIQVTGYATDYTVSPHSESKDWPVYVAGKEEDIISSQPIWNIPKNFGLFSGSAAETSSFSILVSVVDDITSGGYYKDGMDMKPYASIVVPGPEIIAKAHGETFDVTIHRLPETGSINPDGPDPKLTFMRLDKSKLPTTKYVYMTRHGESLWNEAQSNNDLIGMAAKKNHQLSPTGWKDALEMNEKDFADDVQTVFDKATLLISSPLTRCLQTAMVIYKKQIEAGMDIVVASSCKEKKNFMSYDSVGTGTGEKLTETLKSQTTRDACVKHGRAWSFKGYKETSDDKCDGRYGQLMDDMVRLTGTMKSAELHQHRTQGSFNIYHHHQGEAAAARLFTTKAPAQRGTIWPSDAFGKWWLDLSQAEGSKKIGGVENRIRDFADILMYSEHEHIAVSTHSHYIRSFFQEFSPKLLYLQSPQEQHRHCKVANSHTVEIQLEFDEDGMPIIVGQQAVGEHKLAKDKGHPIHPYDMAQNEKLVGFEDFIGDVPTRSAVGEWSMQEICDYTKVSRDSLEALLNPLLAAKSLVDVTDEDSFLTSSSAKMVRSESELQ